MLNFMTSGGGELPEFGTITKYGGPPASIPLLDVCLILVVIIILCALWGYKKN